MKKEKKKMSKRIVGTIIGVVVALVALVVFVFISINQDFDAKTYVSVILDYTYKGKTDIPKKNVEDMFDKESLMHLENQHETQLSEFVQKSVTGGVDMEDEMEEKYLALCKEVFKSLKYKVKTVKKVSVDEYKVTVEYQPTDVFQKYMEATTSEQQRIMDKVEKGEYQGTSDEINLQIQTEAISSNYELLNVAYKDMQYGKSQKMVFTVKRGEGDMFAMDSKELSDFIVKIVGLDEKQD